MSNVPKITADEYFALLEPLQQVVAVEARMCVLSVAPDIMEEIKYGVPFYSYKGAICYLSASKKGVYLGFPNGTIMSDVYELFSGEHLKEVRHIAIPDIYFAVQYREEIKNYVIEAMVLNDTKNKK